MTLRPNANALAALAALAIAAPLLAVVALAVFGAWTDYLAHLAETRLTDYLANTAIVALCACATAGIVGAVSAWLVARYAFPGRAQLEWLLALPLAMPAYAAAYAWFDLTQAAGPLGFLPTVRGPVGAGFIFGLTLYPYVYLLMRETFAGQSSDAYDAARTLGAGPARAFTRIALPMARPALAAGLGLVLMETMADFGAVVHLGAPTLSVALVRAWAGEGSSPDAARLAVLLVTITFLILFIERAQRRRARQHAASGRVKPPRRVRLGGGAALAALAICAIPILAGLVIPMARLGWLALDAPVARGLGEAAINALSLAVITALIAAAFGIVAAYALRSRRPLGVAAARLAGLGYAVPGAVAALGVLIVFGQLQSGLDALWTSAFGQSFPFLLTAGAATLVFAYLSRFAAAAIGPSESALSRVTPSLEGAARSLGAGPRRVITQVHWPILSSGALLAGLLVFVEVLKELPATMILRPFNFDTLAVIAHNYASDERLGEAALPALLIAIFCLPAMVFVARRITRQERRAERQLATELG